ncbi:MAG: diguanylate cyclase, partial [Synergistaceae bacterium]|nr:diguanylate cyclase [Synergistaceae bacterium]
MLDNGPDDKNTTRLLFSAWHAFMAATPDFMFIKNLDLVYVDASKAFAELVGRSSAEDVVGKTDLELFDDRELAERYRSDDRRLLASGEPLLNHIEPIPPDKDGNPRYSSTSKFVFRDISGKILGLYAIGRDVTREYEAKLAYERELDYLSVAGENACASFLLDVTDWTCSDFKGEKHFDPLAIATVEDFLAYAAESVVEDEDVRRFYKTLSSKSVREVYDSGRRRISMEYLRRMPDGAELWVSDEIRLLQDPDTGHVMALFTLSDIDDVKRAQSELTRAVEEDSMTGLLNHDATIRHITRYLEMEGSGGTHAFFMIDVDDFKDVNDTFGHQTGDDVITDIALAIKRVFRETDIVGRVGGDEFIAVMKNISGKRLAAKKAAEIVDALQYDLRTEAGALELSGSVGVSFFCADGKSFETLYAEADSALYRAKLDGKNRYAFVNSSDTEEEGLSPAENQMASSVHLRTLLEDLEGAVVIYDADADGKIKISYTSPSIFKVFKRDPRDIGSSGQKLMSAVLPGDLPGLEDAILVSARRGVSFDYTFRIASDDGAVKWMYLRGAPLAAGGGLHRLLCIITDVTEMKETEEHLKFAELRSRTALQQSPAMLWEVDMRTREMKYVGSAADELGYSKHVYEDAPESVIAEGHIRVDYVKEFRRMFSDLYSGRDGGNYYLMSKDKSGEYVPVGATFQLLRDETGAPYYAIGVREPRILSRELDIYRTLNNSGVFSVRIDEDYTLLYGNDRFYSIIGYTRESMAERLNNKCSLYFHNDSLTATREVINSAISSGRNGETLTVKIISGDGKTKYTQTSGEFVRQPDGYYVMNGVIMDVTEQKKAEIEMRQQTLELDTLVRYTPGGVFSYSADEDDDHFTFISENMLKMLGYTYDEFIAKFNDSFAQMVYCEDRKDTILSIDEQIADSEFDECEYRIETKSGELIWVHDVGHLVVDSDGQKFFYVVIVDITNQKLAEEALRKQKDELSERYDRIVGMRANIDKNVIGSSYFNLSRNICRDGRSVGASVMKLQAAETVDAFFEDYYARTPDLEQLERDGGVFSREQLTQMFKHGEKTISSDHRLTLDNGRSIWVRTSVIMAENPETGDVEGYLYTKDINTETILQMLMNRFVDIEYEFALLIEANTGLLSFVRSADEAIPVGRQNDAYYMDMVNGSLSGYIAQSELELAIKALSLKKVVAELEKCDTYSRSFSVVTKDGLTERKTWKYTYVDDARTIIACMRRDVTDIYNSETDHLTGIYNQTGFARAARDMFEANPDTDFCMLRMDIDHFKVYNDIYGIEAGNELLKVIGQASTSCFASMGVYGRIQGDHFVACLPTEELDIDYSIDIVEGRLFAVQPDFSFVVRCGIYCVDDKKLNVAIMCDRALMALRSTKGRYDVNFAYYDESMRVDMFDKQELVSVMRSSLADGEFGVYLQPQYNQETGAIVGAEALARWFH